MWHHLNLKRGQTLQYFVHQFPSLTHQSVKQCCKLWEKWTSLNADIIGSFHIVQIHLNICLSWHQVSEWLVQTRCWPWPGRSSSATFSQCEQISYTKHVKHLSPYTGCISERMAFAPSPFANRKLTRECCSLRDAFIATSLYLMSINDIMVMSL